MSDLPTVLCIACSWIVLTIGAARVVAETPAPQYNRDVRPLLADKCFHCHGPDAAARQADLRLDQRGSATADRGGYRVIAEGRPADSELMLRITADDAEQRMPPPESGHALQPAEIETLRRWIAAGGEYQSHWSFIAPQRPALPQVSASEWARNPIDRFVLARIESQGWQPAPPADPATAIRRVTLALTGLPPTWQEVAAFERAAQRDPELAYQGLVDRLLQSPRYGERMAQTWLDAARYADTNGYFTDNDRTMWPWRDWVIQAFNQNQPFDEFTIEQLAGDLLPAATREQQIATGFNRNHMVNNETGIIEEEFRVEYVVDRVDTTATVWMGLTLGCARCHDHKYDPLSQRDFYRFFAFFNNLPERGLSGSSGNSAPLLEVPTEAQRSELQALSRTIEQAEQRFTAVSQQLDKAQAAWEPTALEQLPAPARDGLVAHLPLDELTADAQVGLVETAPGMLGQAAQFDGAACIQFETPRELDRDDAFTIAAWIQPQGAGCVVSKMDDANEMRGLDVALRKGKAIVNLVHRWNRNAIRVSTVSSIASGRWQHLQVTYDGSSQAAGVTVYLDGQTQELRVELDQLSGSIRNQQPWRIGRRQASASYRGQIDELRLYERALAAEEALALADRQLIEAIVSIAPEQRTAAQRDRLRAWFIEHAADEQLAAASADLDRLRRRQRRLRQAIPTTMVMRDAEQPREAFLLLRGQYDQPGEAVSAAVPQLLGKADGGERETIPPPNRLGLARWLVDRSHPLTARVTVNRLWQELFGTGIVKTVDDFGTQGDWPSHPVLLDWLAVELVDSGWDIKRLLRLMVTSATFRQSANCGVELSRADPENRWLARGPRFRLSAETIRDNALAISGLLVEHLGGPSVKPYQPAGLWQDVTYDSDQAYPADRGRGLYRRSLYTFWKRQAPPPNMLVFDAPTRETCTVQRTRTNTPLQALVLMNDPTFIEAARQLAVRMLSESSENLAERIAFAFRAATARQPTAEEIRILSELFQQQRAAYADQPDSARELLTVGQSSFEPSLDRVELAAWTSVASVILSLHETITQP